MKTKKRLTIKEKVRRFNRLTQYVEHWPYSPYHDIEMRELVTVVAEVVGGPVPVAGQTKND